jgi:dihydroorotate dehydrogenase electron transfer subunit
MYKNDYELINKVRLSESVYSFAVDAPDIAAEALPGQFLEVSAPGFFLPRPISICDVTGDAVRFVFEIRGGGTKAIADISDGAKLSIMGPLGNGFPTEYKNICVIGGGIGVPPMLFAAVRLDVKTAILGFRDKSAVILENDFRALEIDTKIYTDNGSYGTSGYAPEGLSELLKSETPGAVFACGPTVMLKAVKAICEDKKIPAYLSTEERMACGAGACLGCAVKTRSGNKRVCKDGPVFDAEELIF